MNILCKIFGHIWHDCNYWHDRLKVSIPRRVCLRCGTRDMDYQFKEEAYYNSHTCTKCGAWICDSGICAYCER